MNKLKNHLALLCLCISLAAQGQRLGIGTTSPHGSAVLEVAGTDGGILIPRMTAAQRNAIVTPATGLMVFVTDPAGFWFFNGTSWAAVAGSSGGGGGTSSTIADADGNTKIDVEYTPNEDQIRFQTNGLERMRINMDGMVGIGTDNPGGSFDVAGDVWANLFIDRVSPQYFLDPGSTTTSMSVAGPVKASAFTDASNSTYYLDPGSAGTSLRTAGILQATSLIDENNASFLLDPSNTNISLKVAGRLDATLFQDKDNTSFLVDPASTSTLNNLTLNPSATGPANGLRIRTQSQEYWTINAVDNGDQDLGFYHNGVSRAFLNWDTNVDFLDFTAQHRSLPAEGNISDYKDLVGYIVVSDGTISNLDGSATPGINESLPKVKLSDRENDKRIYGVIARIEEKENGKDSGYREYAQGAFVSLVERADESDYRLVINSAGEGGLWVSNVNGSIQNGDLVTTSPIPGIGMRQHDDLLRNYTVAKVVMDCDFDLNAKAYTCKEVEHEGKTYRMAFLACVYQL